MINIILTGASGFVGSNLTNFFNTKDEFKITSLSLRGDINLAHIKSSDAIIHLAGKAHDLKNTSDSSEYFKVNTELTRKLYDLFLVNDAKDFIYFSSVKAVADIVNGVLTEDVVPNPKTPYGESKAQAEAYLTSQPLPKGKRLFIIRPCMIHGPGNKGNLNLLYKLVSKGIPYPLAAFENNRSFLSIANLNFIIHQLLTNSAIPGGIYNVADDMALSTTDVIKIMSNALGQMPRLWNLNPSLIRTVAAFGDKLHLPLNTERLNKLTENYVVSNEKIKAALKVYNLPVSSGDGLLLTIKSFIEQ